MITFTKNLRYLITIKSYIFSIIKCKKPYLLFNYSASMIPPSLRANTASPLGKLGLS